MGLVTNAETGSDGAVVFIPCSDTKGTSSPLPIGPKTDEKEVGNAEKAKQDKDVAQSASHPLPMCSDSGKPTWRKTGFQPRRKRFTYEERNTLRSLSYSFGNGLLARMSSDKAMMERIHRSMEAKEVLESVLGFPLTESRRWSWLYETKKGIQDSDIGEIGEDGYRYLLLCEIQRKDGRNINHA